MDTSVVETTEENKEERKEKKKKKKNKEESNSAEATEVVAEVAEVKQQLRFLFGMSDWLKLFIYRKLQWRRRRKRRRKIQRLSDPTVGFSFQCGNICQINSFFTPKLFCVCKSFSYVATTSLAPSKLRASTSTSDSVAFNIFRVTSAVDLEFIKVGCCTTTTVC